MRLVLLAAFLFGSSSVALAQKSTSSTDPATMHTDDCARARKLNKTCVLDIGPEDIERGVVKPDLLVVDARLMSRHNSLIRIRKDFIDEILKTANDVD